MKFKRISSALLLSAALMVSSFNVCADGAVRDTIELTIGKSEMLVNGETKQIDPGRDTSPVIQEGRTLVPIRSVIEAMGGMVDWVQEDSKVVLKLKDDEINLIIDSTVATLNGTERTLDVAPSIINERTMLPIRFIAESFKFNVDWDEVTSTVIISKEISEEVIEDILDSENTLDEDDYEYSYEESYRDFYEDEFYDPDYYDSLWKEELWQEDFYEEVYENEDEFYDDYYDDYYEEEFYDEEF